MYACSIAICAAQADVTGPARRMSRMIRRSLPVVASLLMLTGVTAAQQSAHVHGIATLNLAMEGDELEIEFVSPAGNVVGFEHEAVTAVERRAIRDAIEQLKKGNELFDLPPAASCSLHVAEVEHVGPGHGAEHDDERRTPNTLKRKPHRTAATSTDTPSRKGTARTPETKPDTMMTATRTDMPARRGRRTPSSMRAITTSAVDRPSRRSGFVSSSTGRASRRSECRH